MRLSRVVPAAIVAALLPVAPPVQATPSLNLAQATADTKAKLARGEQADIVMIGDSLTFDDTFGFRPYFTQRMQALYGDAGPGYLGAYPATTGYGNDWTTGALGPFDPAPHSALDGLWVTALPSAFPTAGTITSFYDKIELHYLAQPGGGKADLTLSGNGQLLVRLNTDAAAPQVRWFPVDFPNDQPTSVRAQPDGTGPVTFLGINRINDAPGVRVHRVANGGWGVDQFLQRDSTFDQQLPLLNTDLVMVAIGANDASTYGHDEYVAKLNLLVDRIQTAVPCSEIVMIAPYDFGTPAAPVVASAIEDVAAARGLGLINLYETAGSYSFFQQNGYLRDPIHFSQAGAEYVGNLVFEAFRGDGAALPEPASLVGVAAAMGALLARPARRPR